jgi:hypothetical protein
MKKILLLTALFIMVACKKEEIKPDLSKDPKCFIGTSKIIATNTTPGASYYGTITITNDCSGNDTTIICKSNQNYVIWYNATHQLDGGKINLGKYW